MNTYTDKQQFGNVTKRCDQGKIDHLFLQVRHDTGRFIRVYPDEGMRIESGVGLVCPFASKVILLEGSAGL
ncbi:hypothetical protein [Paraflavitalea speifideaquila]|uniref:hypothetical protein n=1 Tax=Paraflavitalea speifideaquila TaxID=3076558 RepID=UPI0028ECEBC4|nr:hypothetical protein [Paraflavitalea speifideiaquila]